MLAGDHIGRFKTGDVFFIGGNLPHVFRNDREFGNGGEKARTISVYFDEQMLGNAFWNLPETKTLQSFLHRPRQAFQLSGDKAETIRRHLEELIKLKGMHRVIGFLSMISCFETEDDLYMLSGFKSRNHLKTYDGDRINRVLEFTFSAYHRPVKLGEVAAIANLSAIAFCRYFKTRTGKTYINFISELRIQEARKLLSETSDSIEEIAYRSGFNNLSHFNRLFKKLTGNTPSVYRTQG